MVQSFGYNDGVLFVSLVYSCVDLVLEWGTFSACSKPIHHWLLLSYLSVMAFRLAHVVGSRAAAAGGGAVTLLGPGGGVGDFLLDKRLKGTAPRVLATLIWTVALPFFTLWTLLGTSWLWRVATETPHCVPSETHLWFSAFWLFLCYAWIVIHAALGVVAWVLERRVRRAEGDLRLIEDDDVRQRWGQVSHIANYQDLAGAAGPSAGEGLSPEQIKALPSESTLGSDEACAGGCECSICLTDLEPGDVVRRLPVCGHTFHRSCIDLWLLRRADCPLCKRCVASAGGSAADREGELV